MENMLALIGVAAVVIAISFLNRTKEKNIRPERAKSETRQPVERAEQARLLMEEACKRHDEVVERERQLQQQSQKPREIHREPQPESPIDNWIKTLQSAMDNMWSAWAHDVQARAEAGFGYVNIKWEPNDINFALTEDRNKSYHDYGSTLWERRTGAQLVVFFRSRGFEIGTIDYVKGHFVSGKVDVSRGINNSEASYGNGYSRPSASFMVRW